jgi:hypothetical protein
MSPHTLMIWQKYLARGKFYMTKRSPIPKETIKQPKVSHPGMMGDGTVEQDLNQRGKPEARIDKKEVYAAFAKRMAK